MRIGSMIGVGVVVLSAVAPAEAQFAAPFGAPSYLTVPEAANGAWGAGAANSAATQQQCTPAASGRDGPRGLCLQRNNPSEPPRR